MRLSLHNCLQFSQLPSCLDEARVAIPELVMRHEKIAKTEISATKSQRFVLVWPPCHSLPALPNEIKEVVKP